MGEFLTIVEGILKTMSGLLTLVIAGTAICIAYQQWKTAREKLKLDLFDRRYQVFIGVVDLIGHVNNQGKPPREAFDQFYRAITPVRFLFDGHVCEYVELVRKKAIELRSAITLNAKATADKCETIPHEQLMNASEKEIELVSWFYGQFEEAGRQFEPALSFKKAL